MRLGLVQGVVVQGPQVALGGQHAHGREGRLAGYEAFDRFYEIGSPAGLRELEAFLSTKEGCR